MTQITGRKGGGGSPRTPVEQPDDLQSVAKAKLLIALGEGEFAGELTRKNIFLDGTPLMNADGSENFPGVVWEYRPAPRRKPIFRGCRRRRMKSRLVPRYKAVHRGHMHSPIRNYPLSASALNGRPCFARRITGIWSVTR